MAFRTLRTNNDLPDHQHDTMSGSQYGSAPRNTMSHALGKESQIPSKRCRMSNSMSMSSSSTRATLSWPFAIERITRQ